MYIGLVNRRLPGSDRYHHTVQHIAEDEAQAMHDAARYARRIRSRLGLGQAEFSRRINVPLETVRNWEQGKRSPSGAAQALLKVLDQAPEAALAALS